MVIFVEACLLDFERTTTADQTRNVLVRGVIHAIVACVVATAVATVVAAVVCALFGVMMRHVV